MRHTFAAIVMIAFPAVASAQSTTTPAPGPFSALGPIGLPLPPIGLPLSPIGLPFPSMGLPTGKVMPTRGRGDQSAQRPGDQPLRHGSRRGSAPGVVYFIPAYGWGSEQPGQMVTPPPAVPTVSPPTGKLQLEVQPAGLLQIQLFVDGYYVGSPGDFNGELDLSVGPHTIEIRATGYETLTFGVSISPQRPLTYRGSLKPSAGESPATAAPDAPQADTPIAPTTIYFIPGCYLGNVPPIEVAANCDLSQLITRKP